MGKGIASGYTPPAEITVCNGCFHKDVCGDKDYLTDNACFAKAGECYCRECKISGHCSAEDTFRIVRVADPFCCAGKSKEAQDDG